MSNNAKADVTASAGLLVSKEARAGVKVATIWDFELVRNGVVIDRWQEHNLIVNAGLDYINDVAFIGATQITTWYVGITTGTPTFAAADTMSSHGGWTETTSYDQANRPTWTGTGTGVGTSDNAASQAVFTINATITAGGAFLVSNNTKGGSTGTLAAGVAFTGGNRSLVDDDVLNVRVNTSVTN